MSNFKTFWQLLSILLAKLKTDESRFDDLMQAAEEVDLRYNLWLGLKEVATKSSIWTATHFDSLDIDNVEETVTK
jgi:dynein heavy chain